MRKARVGSWRAYDPDAASPATVIGAARLVTAPRVRVLGLDPGSRRTGYGIVDACGPELVHVAHGCIDVKADEFATRLRRIHGELAQVFANYQPMELAIERVFVSRNVDSALKLGQARGAALAAVPVAVAVHQYAPRAVKLAIVGAGGADKAQVQHMVTSLLQLGQRPNADAADALAIAICHASHRRLALLGSVTLPAVPA
ncbi:MAG TPA: crossover junction endodeoxyribonuclease RuvC [Steroidobacteraceae bacterium]|nr:crossover junction endodeoxyribonuclease RuvC [Steroidobacteraceae bacterium]HRX89021.1 crossover junction endodeoxyribonuclease RuvC [Steroidobacteraceae bacterium]